MAADDRAWSGRDNYRLFGLNMLFGHAGLALTVLGLLAVYAWQSHTWALGLGTAVLAFLACALAYEVNLGHRGHQAARRAYVDTFGRIFAFILN
ncbi:hypothetical protein ABT160_37245 [Streptomyces sp. NPDC001941]|uniref:hypothetical protein n=1 Tax=Streptomyces sp. NPDC001941 TaxID=3154659 RepID=UPI00331B1B3E